MELENKSSFENSDGQQPSSPQKSFGIREMSSTPLSGG
jgi:hypothetical protein